MTTLPQNPVAGRTNRRVLSMWQPWASLLVSGEKQIETRSWPTQYRGPILIHAGKAWGEEIEAACSEPYYCHSLEKLGFVHPHSTAQYTQSTHRKTWRDLPRGAIIGAVELIDVLPTEELIERGLMPREMAFGDYSEARYGWVCQRPVMFKTPIPCRGEQGLYFLRSESSEAVEREEFIQSLHAAAGNDGRM